MAAMCRRDNFYVLDVATNQTLLLCALFFENRYCTLEQMGFDRL